MWCIHKSCGMKVKVSAEVYPVTNAVEHDKTRNYHAVTGWCPTCRKCVTWSGKR